jgi:hypothetical protein
MEKNTNTYPQVKPSYPDSAAAFFLIVKVKVTAFSSTIHQHIFCAIVAFYYAKKNRLPTP